MVVGATVFAFQKDSEPPPHPRDEEKPHPAVLRNRAIQAVMLPVVFLGAFFSAVGLVVVAFAQEHDAVGRTGLLLAAWALGSAIAAFVNGSIKWKKNNAQRFWIFLLALTLLSLPFLFVTNFTFLIIALFFNGFSIAPLMVSAYGVAESVVPQEQVTETLAWVFIALPIGGAIASALSGWVIDNYGARAGLIIPFASLTCALITLLPYFRTWNRLRSAS
jgi:predicted MFS family arabinose efflux permease